MTVHPFMETLAEMGMCRLPDRRLPPPPPDLPAAAPDAPEGRAYAEAALRDEAQRVAHAPQGTRNDALNTAAFKLGSLVAAGFLPPQTVIDTLVSSARRAGLPQGEINRTVYRAARDGATTPRQVRLAEHSPRGIDTTFALGGVLPSATRPVPASPNGTTLSLVNGSGTGRGQVGDSAAGEPDTAGNASAAGVSPSPAEALMARYPPLVWAAEWQRSPGDVDWLAYPVLERGGMYALYSPAKAGKSLLALDICAGLATGRSVLGRPARQPVTVLYVDMENGTFDIVSRLREFGYTPDDLARLLYLSFPAFPALDSPAGGAHLVSVALSHAVDVVVIDTVSRFIAGGENDSDTFHALYRHTLAPLKRHGLTVIRLDHTGKDEERGMRGSSAKVSDVDVAWRLTRIGQGRLRLDRIAARNSHHPEYVVLNQLDGPLRHELVPSDDDERTDRLVALLDKWGVPKSWGRDRVRSLLIENGISTRNRELSAAIRARRTTFGDAE